MIRILMMVTLFCVLIPVPASAEDTEFLPPRADAGLITVEQLLGKGRYSQAIGALEPILKRQPENADALTYLGYAYLKLGENRDAKKYLDRALRYNKKHLGAHQYLGEYYLSEGRNNLALERLQVIRTICYTGGCAEQIGLEMAINRGAQPAETN